MWQFLFNAACAIGWVSYGLAFPADTSPFIWFVAGVHSAFTLTSVVMVALDARR